VTKLSELARRLRAEVTEDAFWKTPTEYKPERIEDVTITRSANPSLSNRLAKSAVVSLVGTIQGRDRRCFRNANSRTERI